MNPTGTADSTVTLSRQDLYTQVWSTPVVQLAMRYGLSDVGLAKACKRHHIPRPSVGYWAKKAVGRAPRPTPLPVVTDPKLQSVQLTRTPKPTPASSAPADTPASTAPPPSFTDPEIIALHERFVQQFPEIRVPEALRSPLPIVTATLSALKLSVQESSRLAPGVRDGHHSPSSAHVQPCLDVCVTRPNFERAMRFMNTLLRAFFSCGFKIHTFRDSYSRTVLLEVPRERYRLGLSEPYKKVPHVPTPEEIERHETYGTRVPKTHDEPSGELCLTLSGDRSNHVIRSWPDAKPRRLEERIPEIIGGILEQVDLTRAREKANAEIAQQHAKEAQRRLEEEQRRKQEQVQIDAMFQEIERWERARRVRRYLRALESTVLEYRGSIAKGSELDVWLDWASRVADRTDPTTPYTRTQGQPPVAAGNEPGTA